MTIITIVLTVLLQSYIGMPRLQSFNEQWALPVATNILCSDEHRHVNRGSVLAWDLCAPFGSDVYALGPGIVTYAGCNNQGGYGCWVRIDHYNGWKAIYAHNIDNSITVGPGQEVNINTRIGRIGWTGMTSFGPHTHLEISHNGDRVMIDKLFDKNQLLNQPLMSFSGNVKPYVAKGTIYSSSQFLSQGFNWMAAMLIFILYFLFWFFYSHKKYWVQNISNVVMILSIANISHILTALAIVIPGGSTQLPTTMHFDDQWTAVYKFIEAWEGNSDKCVFDPIKTMNGVTNNTYNLWRQQQGLGPGDVCTQMTQEQKMMIYYDKYYITSGANTLPLPISLQIMDISMLSGVGKGRDLYAQCGEDFWCYTRLKIVWFKSLRNCSLYCTAWIRRANDIDDYLKTGIANGRQVINIQ